MHHFLFDPDVTPPSMAIVTALSKVRNIDHIVLEPLQDTIDTDSLDAILQSHDDQIQLTCQCAGYEVTVHSQGAVTVAKPDESEAGTRAEEGSES